MAIQFHHTNEIGEEEVLLLRNEDNTENEIDALGSYTKALMLNENYQNTLKDFLSQMEEELKQNQLKQKEVEQQIEELGLGKGKSKGHHDQGDNRLHSLFPSKKSLMVFSAPYFKDVDLYSHPPNPDTKKKQENNELDVYFTPPNEWTKIDRLKLSFAVREDALKKEVQFFMKQVKKLVDKARVPGTTDEEKEQIMFELEMIKAKVDDVKQTPDEILLSNRDKEFDWMQIAVQKFDNSKTPKSCEMMWKNLLHPSINRRSWRKDEDLALSDLVKEKEALNWDQIAKWLNTNRTGLQCLMRYQQKLNISMKKTRWTSDEDQTLKQLVNTCRINDYIPWNKVSFHMNQRTKEQCYQRYTYSLKDTLKKGAFTEQEDFIIMIGVRLFGECWSKLTDFLPNRSVSQVHSRYNHFLKPDFEGWTTEEDRRLLQLVDEYGTKNWSQVANAFENKTRTQCSTRFTIIYNHYKRDKEKFDLKNIRKSNLQQKRQNLVKQKLEESLASFLVKKQQTKDYVLSEETGYQQTPEGIKIPDKDLYEFLYSLKADVSFKVDKEDRAKNVPSSSDLSTAIVKPSIKVVKQTPKGKTKVFVKKNNGQLTPETKVDYLAKKLDKLKKSYIIQFRPSWSRKKGRIKASYNPNEMQLIDQTLLELCSIFKCNNTLDLKRLSKSQQNIMDSRDKQLFQLLCCKPNLHLPKFQIKENLVEEQQRVNVMENFNIPVRKTYSRKRKTPTTMSPNPPNIISNVTFVPPNYSTVMGLRGLLLLRRKLIGSATKESGHYGKALPDINNVLSEGIFAPDILEEAGKYKNLPSNSHHLQNIKSPNEELSEEQADELLFQRFRSLFYWPSIMSGLMPSSSSVTGNLFENSSNHDETMSAFQPFDASDIINEAQSRPATKKIKFVLSS